MPYVMGYYLCGKRHKLELELGGGMGAFIAKYNGLASIMLYGNVGYRYQQKDGLIFRIGVTPWMAIPLKKEVKFWAMPWAGISLNYSF